MKVRLEIPFTGPTYESESKFASPQECINFYLRPYPDMGEDKLALFGTPGLELFHDPNNAEEVRALFPTKSYLYAVVGDQFLRVTKGGTSSAMGNLAKNSGIVGIASNGLDITMVEGNKGYVYDLAAETFTQITDLDFPGGDNIVHIDGYYLVTRPNTGQIYRSDWNDGLNWVDWLSLLLEHIQIM